MLRYLLLPCIGKKTSIGILTQYSSFTPSYSLTEITCSYKKLPVNKP